MDETNLAEEVATVLRGTGRWTRFVSIMLFIYSGLMLIMAITTVIVMSSFASSFSAVMFIFYFLIALFYVYPATRLWLFSRACRSFQIDYHAETMVTAFDQHRKFWKFFGIVTIVLVSFFALIIPFTILMIFIPGVQP